MNEVTEILQILSIADLSDIDARLRTFKNNHKEFKLLQNKYQRSEKPHYKQMINTLHSMEGFNNDIIKYLEVKKESLKKKPD